MNGVESSRQKNQGGPQFRLRDGSSNRAAGIASYLIPGAAVAVLMLLLIRLQGQIETGAANVASLLPLGYAFAAGMVASVNPCGVLLLPSYISYQLGGATGRASRTSPAQRLSQALVLGGMATLGFVVVLAAVGLVIGAGGRWLVTVFPYAGVVVGGLMSLLGFGLVVTDRQLSVDATKRIASRATGMQERSLSNNFLFGVLYAVGSLSCTLPIFLVVVGSSLTSDGLVGSLGQFVGYALGMGMVLIAVTVGVALFRRAVARGLRMVLPYVHRASAMFLVGAGAYLIYYWIAIGGLLA
jgi:cytochrome c biogenesis protein CcdA